MTKWLRLAGLLLLAIAIVVVIASLAVRQVAMHRAERDFPPPGRVVEVDGRRAHIHCVGTGSPTILLESGLDDRGSWGWDHLLGELSAVSRVCAYDRAGFLWSEPREGPRDAERIAQELHAVLAAASEAPPYVLVGHSNAGLSLLVFTGLYPHEVAGLVFVDASHPAQNSRWPAEVRQVIDAMDAEPDRRWLFRWLAPYRIFTGERPTARTAYWWRSFPDGVLAEARAVDAMSLQAGGVTSVGSRPVAVLTAGVPTRMPPVSAQGNAAMRRVWLDLQRELADLSTNSVHRIVDGAGHYIHWDRPEAVIDAIRDVVTASREGRRMSEAAAGSGATPREGD
jgi:pimeloyl-ACP methyl ester carboxylesterase